MQDARTSRLKRGMQGEDEELSPPHEKRLRVDSFLLAVKEKASGGSTPPSVIDLTSLSDDGVSTAEDTGDSSGPWDFAASALPSACASNAPRRSGRERQSTTVRIDGHVVKKANNYVVRGHSYHYHALKDSQKPNRTKKQAAPRKPPPLSKGLNQALETDRLDRVAAVKARVQQKSALRQAYLALHVDKLEPFVEPKIASVLRSSTFCEDTRRMAVVHTASNCHRVFLQPDSVKAEMRDYQMQGLEWMVKMHKSNLPMILGDEMGLGKTLQTISLLCYLKETEKVTGPSLVICPLSVLYSWCHEIERWAPSLKFLRFHSSSSDERESQRLALVEHFASYDVIITTFEMAKSPSLLSLWRRQYFHYLVLDEGHIIKNRNSQISDAVRKLHFENALLLSGTPLQNDLVELYNLLNFLYPEVFTTPRPFADAFCLRGKQLIDRDMLGRAHELVNLFMLRRLKEQVEKLLPEKLETKVICPLSETQVFWYKGLLLKNIESLVHASEKSETNSASSSSYHQLSNLMMQLRKCCGHPFLFSGAEVSMDETTCEDLVAASGKLAVLDMLLRTLHQKGHRVVLFSQFTLVLDILEDYCTMRGWNFCRFDGSTPRARRNLTVKQFNDPESDDFIFLMSTRSGGMGLNLQTADTCILFDSDYNPQPDLQAMARVHRIGQQKKVHVYRLISGGTIEEKIVERAQKKLFLDQMVNHGSVETKGNQENSALSMSELLATLKFGCNAVFGEAAVGGNLLPKTEEIELITDRTRTEDFSFGNLKGGSTQHATDFDTSAKERLDTGTDNFGGVDFKAIRDARTKKYKTIQGLAEDWAGLRDKKRQRKSRIVMLAGNRSGYGSASVPVLASNNYDLEGGETSVFERELAGRHGKSILVKKKTVRSFGEQDFCQVCGDGGELLICPRCPVCVHIDCVGAYRPKDFHSCPHHRCSLCQKNFSDAGGILFPCQSCSICYCEDCMPETVHRVLGGCDRFEELGFDSTKQNCYIHCTAECEKVARSELGWQLKVRHHAPCPPPMDVSYAFGKRSASVCSDMIHPEPVTNGSTFTVVADHAPKESVVHAPVASSPTKRPLMTRLVGALQKILTPKERMSPETSAPASPGSKVLEVSSPADYADGSGS